MGQPQQVALGEPELPGSFASVYAPGDGVDLALGLDGGLFWKVACKTGTLALSPGPGQIDVEKPLHLTSEMFDDVKEAFDDRAFKYVTVPETHANGALENTGYVKQLEVVDKATLLQDVRLDESLRQHVADDPPDTRYMLAGIDFTEPEVRARAERGSIPDTSIGVKFNYRNKGTGKLYRAALNHLALTPNPWNEGMPPFAASALLSQDSGGVFVDLGLAQASTDARAALPDGAFALPGRHYPVHDERSARASFERVAAFGSSDDKKMVLLAIAQRHPDLQLTGTAMHDGMNLGFGAIHFDPDAHPRNLKGQFKKVLGGLLEGQKVDLPDGTEVTRREGRFDVTTRHGMTVHTTRYRPDEIDGAAKEALEPAITAQQWAEGNRAAQTQDTARQLRGLQDGDLVKLPMGTRIGRRGNTVWVHRVGGTRVSYNRDTGLDRAVQQADASERATQKRVDQRRQDIREAVAADTSYQQSGIKGKPMQDLLRKYRDTDDSGVVGDESKVLPQIAGLVPPNELATKQTKPRTQLGDATIERGKAYQMERASNGAVITARYTGSVEGADKWPVFVEADTNQRFMLRPDGSEVRNFGPLEEVGPLVGLSDRQLIDHINSLPEGSNNDDELQELYKRDIAGKFVRGQFVPDNPDDINSENRDDWAEAAREVQELPDDELQSRWQGDQGDPDLYDEMERRGFLAGDESDKPMYSQAADADRVRAAGSIDDYQAIPGYDQQATAGLRTAAGAPDDPGWHGGDWHVVNGRAYTSDGADLGPADNYIRFEQARTDLMKSDPPAEVVGADGQSHSVRWVPQLDFRGNPGWGGHYEVDGVPAGASPNAALEALGWDLEGKLTNLAQGADSSLRLSFAHIQFDESKIRRALDGKFAKKLGSLADGESVRLPAGTTVTRQDGRVRVLGKNGREIAHGMYRRDMIEEAFNNEINNMRLGKPSENNDTGRVGDKDLRHPVMGEKRRDGLWEATSNTRLQQLSNQGDQEAGRELAHRRAAALPVPKRDTATRQYSVANGEEEWRDPESEFKHDTNASLRQKIQSGDDAAWGELRDRIDHQLANSGGGPYDGDVTTGIKGADNKTHQIGFDERSGKLTVDGAPVGGLGGVMHTLGFSRGGGQDKYLSLSEAQQEWLDDLYGDYADDVEDVYSDGEDVIVKLKGKPEFRVDADGQADIGQDASLQDLNRLMLTNHSGTMLLMTAEEILASQQAEQEAQSRQITDLQTQLTLAQGTIEAQGEQLRTESVSKRVAQLQEAGYPPALCVAVREVLLADRGDSDLCLSVQQGDSAKELQNPTEIVEFLLSAIPVQLQEGAAQFAAVQRQLGQIHLAQHDAAAKSQEELSIDVVDSWERETHPERFADNGKGDRL